MSNTVSKWRRTGHGRHSISRQRRLLGWLMLSLVLAGGIGYRQLTREERLRGFAEAWLAEFSGGDARIERVRFSLFHGLDLIGVTVATPLSAQFDPHDDSLAARTIFRSSTVFFRLRPLSIITGKLVVPEIVAINPELILVNRARDGLGNWETLFQNQRKHRKSTGPIALPIIRLNNARLMQYRLDEHGRSGGDLQSIRADAHPLPDQPQVYDVQITKLVETTEASTSDTANLRIDVATNTFTGNLPIMNLQDVAIAAPHEVATWLEQLNIQGMVRADDLYIEVGGPAHATLKLSDVRFAVPLGWEEQRLLATERYAQFESLGGTVDFDGRTGRFDLAGKFRGCPVSLRGQVALNNEASNWENIALDAEISLQSFPLPRNDPDTDPAERRLSQTWPWLATFIQDYDGKGLVELNLHLRKNAGADQKLQIPQATLTVKGASGRYFRFPYRLEQITGQVRFLENGHIELDQLAGVHGKARASISGQLAGTKRQDQVHLEITGQDVRLDDDFLPHIGVENQALCQQFNPDGVRMNLQVTLDRPQSLPNTPESPWERDIQVELTNGKVKFADFPYPLERITGRMHFTHDRITLDKLCARNGPARVCLSGISEKSPTGDQLNLSLSASDVPMDGTLVDALPEKLRESYRQFNPTGRADLQGTLTRKANQNQLQCDFQATLHEAELTLAGTSARLKHVAGELHILPPLLEVKHLQGMFGQSPIELHGATSLEAHPAATTLDLHSAALRLDARLANALPPAMRAQWDALAPTGLAEVDLHYAAASATSPTDYTITIRPLRAEATLPALPLRLTELNGTIKIAPQQVQLQSVTAHIEPGTLRMDGSFDAVGEAIRANLQIHADGLAFNEALRTALPWRYRRAWNDIQPRGRFDLHLSRLAFEQQPNHPTQYHFDGTLRLHDAQLTVGAALSEMNATLTAKGFFGQALSIDGQLELPSARVNGYQVTNLKTQLHQSEQEPILRLGDMTGLFYGGTIAGKVEVDHSQRKAQYGVSLTVHDLSLGSFLNARLAPGEKPIQAKGVIEGNLMLTGEVDNPATRRGGGCVTIREAQILKVPLMLAMLQVIHLAIADDNAFHDALLDFVVDADEIILEQIDLRGKGFSMVGAGRVQLPGKQLDLTLLVGSPLKLPRMEVLSDLLEGLAREIMEVKVGGTLARPTFQADIIRSLRKTSEALLNAKARRPKRQPRRAAPTATVPFN